MVFEKKHGAALEESGIASRRLLYGWDGAFDSGSFAEYP